MQAIQVKYLGPTNTKGSRVKAFCAGGSITRHIDNAYSVDENKKYAAIELAKKLGWPGNFRSGTLPNGDLVWVIGSENEFFITNNEHIESYRYQSQLINIKAITDRDYIFIISDKETKKVLYTSEYITGLIAARAKAFDYVGIER